MVNSQPSAERFKLMVFVFLAPGKHSGLAKSLISFCIAKSPTNAHSDGVRSNFQ